MMKQLKFGFFKNSQSTKAFGGELLSGKRNAKRPLSVKAPIHLVLRATQSKVFRPQNRSLKKLIHRVAKESGVQIYELAINWSHIHFVILIRHRESYVRFVRVLTSKISTAFLAAQTGNSMKALEDKLFTLRPFTRILEWGRDFRNAVQYLKLNQKKARGEVRPTKVAKGKRELQIATKLQTEGESQRGKSDSLPKPKFRSERKISQGKAK
jgi:REP element-mobilizing transposase RayT